VAGLASTARAVRDDLRATPPRELLDELLDAFDRNDLLTYASAIAFRVFFALVPFLLFLLGLLGGLGLDDVWTEDVAPQLRESSSAAAFEVMDTTVRKVLGDQQGFWLTIGLVITIWEMSAAARGIMGVFDRIYDSKAERGTVRRFAVSIGLASAAGALIVLAVALWHLGPPLLGGWVAWVRWPVVLVLLLAVMALFVRWGPADHQPVAWVGLGSALTVVAWIVTSTVFVLYVTKVADYGSIFGALATIMVVLGYLYFAAAAFLTGAQLDALVRRRVRDDPSG
jgi:membrane protein